MNLKKKNSKRYVVIRYSLLDTPFIAEVKKMHDCMGREECPYYPSKCLGKTISISEPPYFKRPYYAYCWKNDWGRITKVFNSKEEAEEFAFVYAL